MLHGRRCSAANGSGKRAARHITESDAIGLHPSVDVNRVGMRGVLGNQTGKAGGYVRHGGRFLVEAIGHRLHGAIIAASRRYIKRRQQQSMFKW
jgi:hypothetical protein